jgi:uncharacterized protein (DUF1697 family)
MALVLLLRGVNVGGHRTFRPSVLAKELDRFGVVNIGAAGTFVIRKPIAKASLRAELAHLLPFQTAAMICDGRDVLRLVAADPFARQPSRPDIVRFVSVLAKRRPPPVSLPLDFPSEGRWCLRILGCDSPFVWGLYRREMQAIRYLDKLDRMFAVPVTTRNWNTILAIARVLQDGRASAQRSAPED